VCIRVGAGFGLVSSCVVQLRVSTLATTSASISSSWWTNWRRLRGWGRAVAQAEWEVLSSGRCRYIRKSLATVRLLLVPRAADYEVPEDCLVRP
jgi:hypothetical protein